MPVFALYEFDDSSVVLDEALGNGAQDGMYINGATATGGQLVLDGVNQFVKIFVSDTFQMPRGTLEINFTPTSDPVTSPQTVLSRDSVGQNEGSYRMEVMPDGSIRITHEVAGSEVVTQTEPNFYEPGQTINVTYSWDEGGDGGRVVFTNTTTGTTESASVPNSVTMDMGSLNQDWMIGTDQNLSDPDTLNNLGQYFQGTVDFFSISDSVDNLPDNGDPVANPDTAVTDEDVPVVIDVLANDSDPDSDPLTVTEATAPNGTVTINPDGTLTYTPNQDWNGEDTITYTITDPSGNTATSTVTVTVNPVNDDPDANDDFATTTVGTPITVEVLSNDTDVDGDTLTVTSLGTSPDGTAVLNPDGTVTFTPNAGFTGTTQIEYEISDGQGGTSTATLHVTVNPGPGGPVANPDTAVTDEDVPVVIDVLGNDSDPDGDPLTVTEAEAGNGTVTINPDGTLTYTPNPDWNGEDTITYTITDPSGNTATSTVEVTVNPVNDDPDANDDRVTTPFQTTVVIPVLTNDTDVDGDALTITSTTTSPDGEITVNPDGTISFTPNAGFSGEARFEYTVSDGNGGTATAEVVVLVGTPGRDGIIYGTDGDDLIDHTYVDPDGDVVDGNDALIPGDGPNDDRIYAGRGNDTIIAGVGNDLVYAGPGDDLVYGGPGDDTIHGGDGRDTVYGGAGNDYIDTRNPDPTTYLPDIDYPGLYDADPDPENDRDLVYGGAGNDTIFTGDDADTIYGGRGDDYIDSGIDADLVYGGQGNDTIIGGEGADTIYGGAGDDLIYGGLGPIGEDILDIPDDRDLRPDNNRDELYGGGGNDTIYGRDDDDTLYGGAGDDLLYGGVDDDLLFGGNGNDTLHGDQGNDTLEGDAGDDLMFGGIGNDVLRGGGGNDTLHGDDGDDLLFGGNGHDVLYGGAGNDTLHGGAGNDTLYGGAGRNEIYGGGDRDLIIIDSQDGGIGTYVDGNENGDDWDTLDLTGAGPLRIRYDDDNPENGLVTFYDRDGNETGQMRFVNIEHVIPCFTPGTLIATPKGEVPAEMLKAGDRVITRDNGIQEIRWTGQKALTGAELRLNNHLQPVLVKKHSLGNGLPEQDMLVSPNHRLLVANDRTQLYFDEHEVLVAAKHLVGAPGIHAVEAIGVNYIHFMCDRHEVVLSNGAWTESFQPGDFTLKGMGNAQRNEIFELFPELKTEDGLESYQAARRTLKRHEARLLAR